MFVLVFNYLFGLEKEIAKKKKNGTIHAMAECAVIG
jgi:hypothetical protein